MVCSKRVIFYSIYPQIVAALRVTSGLRFSQNRVSYIIPGAGNGGGFLDLVPLYLRTTKNIATPAPASINTDPTTITAIAQAGKSESELGFIVHSLKLVEMV